MNNTSLKFRADFYANTKVLDLTDIIASAGYDALFTAAGISETHEDVVGIFKAQSPSGVFYGGTAFNNDDFSAPDVDGSDPDWVKSSITLPLSGSAVMCGAYPLAYKARLNLIALPVGVTSGKIVITGADYTSVLIPGNKIQVFSSYTPTGNEGVYTIVSSTFSTNTTVTISETVTDFTADADDRLGLIFETSNAFTYCYESPITDLGSESSCIYSTLTATDETITYEKLFTGYSTVSPTVVRAWRFTCPSGYSASPVTAGNLSTVTIGYGTSYNSGKNLWTGDYSMELTSTLTYYVDLWGTGTYWAVVHDSIVSNHAHEVECDTCFCDIKQCIANMITRYKLYLDKKPAKAAELRDKIIQISAAWTMYQIEERCGGNFTQYCTEIATIVASEDCQCQTDTTVSKEVIPLALQVNGSTIAAGITFGKGGKGFPASPDDGDMHTFIGTDGGYTKGDIYWFTGGSWEFQYNNVGTDGADGNDGSTGSTGATGADGVAVIFDNTLETPVEITSTSYETFTGMETGTLANLATLGDKYQVRAGFATNSLSKTPDTVKITIDGLDMNYSYLPAPLNSMPIEHSFANNVKFIYVSADITVIDVQNKKLYVKYTVEIIDSFANVLSCGSTPSIITLTSALNSFKIAAKGKIGATGKVFCGLLSVTFFKK